MYPEPALPALLPNSINDAGTVAGVYLSASSAEFVGEFAGIQRDDRLRNRWSFLQVESKERCWSSSDSIA